jgi:hypothetical protein
LTYGIVRRGLFLIGCWTLARRIRLGRVKASQSAEAPTESNPSSEKEIAAVAREAQLVQLAAIDSIDGKAANLIAFSGIVVGLVFTSTFASAHWSLLLSLGAGMLGGGMLPLAVILLVRRPRFDPGIGALSDVFSGLSPETTNREIARSIASAVERNEGAMQKRIRALRLGACLIIGGLALVATSLIYSHYDTNEPRRKSPQYIRSDSAVSR